MNDKALSEREGVIKFELIHRTVPLDIEPAALTVLNIQRRELMRHGLLGRDPQRYDGLGFGNISWRCPGSRRFVISGTQTGHLTELVMEDLAQVDEARPRQNQLLSHGECKPSSEAMTHAVAYNSSDCIQAVVHVHAPEIWKHVDALELASTAADIAYGTPAMAEATTTVLRALADKPLPWVFVMRGHQDGVVCVGPTIGDCVESLVALQAQARSLFPDGDSTGVNA